MSSSSSFPSLQISLVVALALGVIASLSCSQPVPLEEHSPVQPPLNQTPAIAETLDLEVALEPSKVEAGEEDVYANDRLKPPILKKPLDIDLEALDLTGGPPFQPVVIRCKINVEGAVLEADFEKRSGIEVLDAAAIAALRKAVFEAATLDGKPVPVDYVLVIKPDPLQ